MTNDPGKEYHPIAYSRRNDILVPLSLILGVGLTVFSVLTGTLNIVDRLTTLENRLTKQETLLNVLIERVNRDQLPRK